MIFQEAMEIMKKERVNQAANGLKEIQDNCLDLSGPEKNDIDDAISLLKEYKEWLGKERTDQEKGEEKSEVTREEHDWPEEELVNKTFGLNFICLVGCQLNGSIYLDVRSDSECVLLKINPSNEEPKRNSQESPRGTIAVLTLKELKALSSQIDLAIEEAENG